MKLENIDKGNSFDWGKTKLRYLVNTNFLQV